MRVPWPMTLFRELYAGRRLLFCGAVGVALFLVFPEGWGTAIRCALAWILAVGCFLGLTVYAAGDAAPDRLRARARRQDSSRWAILALIVLAAAVSLVAVAVLLHKQDGETLTHLAVRITLVAGVVMASWSLTHTVFSLHYAHGYYGDGPTPGPDDAGGLLFPGDDRFPDFWDFLYFALVIGMTCQVSDVQITGRHMRWLAAMHGVLSFFFNTVILALTINFLVNTFQ
jgi:uncharacterized membrane protein